MTTANEIRPGELVLANRVRQTLPAAVRDRLLPDADPDLVSLIGREQGVTHIGVEDAKKWVVSLVLVVGPEMEGTEHELARMRIATYWKDEEQR